MNEEERYMAVEACKWVDEVVRGFLEFLFVFLLVHFFFIVVLLHQDAPYYTSVEFCKKYNVDYIIHGDDISVGADGTDTYAEAKAAGMFR